MKLVILLGPPGAGKGTQASFLTERLGAKHFSTGAVFREEIAAKSVIGVQIKTLVESGGLVSDEILFDVICLRIDSWIATPGIVLLDGVIRTIPQAEALDKMLAERHVSLGQVLVLTARVEALVERFANRWVCKSCSEVYSFTSGTEAQATVCHRCGLHGSLYRREDDSAEAVVRRFQLFEKQTAPLVDFYRPRGIVTEIDGLGPREEVYENVLRALEHSS